MRKVLALTAALALLCLGSLVQADVFNLGAGLTNLETVPVGDPGNLGEFSGEGLSGVRICGQVSYTYNIGKYEVTAAQYTDFLNKVAATDTYGLYNTNMWSGPLWGCGIQRLGSAGSYTYSVAANWANRPVNWVSCWDACRFANWLHNGQPTGVQNALTTEDGAYLISGYNGNDGRTIRRKAGWSWSVTSEDEWYKAAYYKGGSTNEYWHYPTQSNLPPWHGPTNPDSGNNANYWHGDDSTPTQVGEFENSGSHYSTFDQGGNIEEWVEYPISIYAYRGLRGGAFRTGVEALHASVRYPQFDPTYETVCIGFRVSAVPEPSSLMVLAGGLIPVLGLRKRRA